MDSYQIGLSGEATAEAFLRRLGYLVLHRNFRSRYGEIDLVARDPLGKLIAVEVKTRQSTGFGYPEDAVGPGKRQRLISTAAKLLDILYPTEDIRFDVVSIVKTGKTTCIMHFIDAFRP